MNVLDLVKDDFKMICLDSFGNNYLDNVSKRISYCDIDMGIVSNILNDCKMFLMISKSNKFNDDERRKAYGLHQNLWLLLRNCGMYRQVQGQYKELI